MNVYIVGGGAAGMLCAITSAREGAEVTLIEKNEKLGKKLYITGKGRCNLTNNSDLNNYMNNIVRNNKFMYSALREFDSNLCQEFFESIGLKLKTERGNRVFPISDKSSDVIKALTEEIKRLHINVKLCEYVVKIESIDKALKIHTNKSIYQPDKIIIATGGVSYPLTGSTGDGYKFAQYFGHSITDIRPGLCGIILSEEYNLLPKLQGLSLKNVNVSIINKNNKKILFQEFGEMLFTDKGVSGPTILTLSSKINRLDFNSIQLTIDLKPALSEQQLDERLLRDFSQNKNKQIKNSLFELLPKSIIPFIIKKSNIDENITVNTISKNERKQLVSTIKNLIMQPISLENIEKAIITSGGISVKEINPKTMESKLIENIYFIGEVLDIDALTGGYNLQIAFATGYCAGKNIIKNK